MLIEKTFFFDDSIPLHNFEFQKKLVLLLTKDFSPEVFTVVSFFKKEWVVQKMQPKGNSIELSTLLKYGLTEAKKAPW